MKIGVLPRLVGCGLTVAVLSSLGSPAFAQSTGKIDGADTAWMIVATGIVLRSSIPGLALFYAGMVRKKNVLAIMAQSLAATALVSIALGRRRLHPRLLRRGQPARNFGPPLPARHGQGSVNPLAKTIPECLFMLYQMTFAIITVALVAGSVADRMRFSAYLIFSAAWLIIVYVPIAHWVWGNGFLGTAGVLDFAGGTVVHVNAGVAGLIAALMLKARRGYGSEKFSHPTICRWR